MLKQVQIKNFAIIEATHFELDKGLTILSGETGAGKSILIDAISCLTGVRADKGFVRQGETKAVVEALFQEVRDFIPFDVQLKYGLSEDLAGQDELWVSREIYAQGKSQCRINGIVVNNQTLRELMSYLIDIHGQNDQQSIFKAEMHLTLLDQFSGQALWTEIDAWQKARLEYLELIEKLNFLGKDPQARQRQIELLRYQIAEIEQANIEAEEDLKLKKRLKLLAALERIQQDLHTAYQVLNGESDNSILAQLAFVEEKLKFAAEHSQSVAKQKENLVQIQTEIEGIAALLVQLNNKAEAKPEEMALLEKRLDIIYKLKTKYGQSIQEIQEFLEKAQQELAALEEGSLYFSKLQEQKLACQEKLTKIGLKIFKNREKVAGELEKEIKKELKELAMPQVDFAIEVRHDAELSSVLGLTGMDHVRFLFSANKGEEKQELSHIVSGGEAARVLLAIKSILAEVDQLGVMIFDEIDTGVSGYTAGKVAEKLRQISGGRQVLCITHMAQIAAAADQQFLIEKNLTAAGRTQTHLRRLDLEGRYLEVARLLSGRSGDQKALNLAKDLVEQWQLTAPRAWETEKS